MPPPDIGIDTGTIVFVRVPAPTVGVLVPPACGDCRRGRGPPAGGLVMN